MAVSIKVKKALIRKLAFFKLLSNFFKLPAITFRLTYTKNIYKTVAQVLINQMTY